MKLKLEEISIKSFITKETEYLKGGSLPPTDDLWCTQEFGCKTAYDSDIGLCGPTDRLC